MSRIGNQPVPVPSGVEVSINGSSVAIKGPKGELNHELPKQITMTQEGDELVLERPDDERDSKALHGLSRSLIQNMVTGVSEGYTRTLDIVGVGYRAIAKGNDKLEMSLGFSHTIDVQAPEGVTFDVPTATQIHVVGIDKQAVGQTAANIRALRKPEPYKGKGVRYSDEHVVRKAGKAAK